MANPDLNSLLDDWSEGTPVVLSTNGGKIFGTIAGVGRGVLRLSSACIDGLSVSVINVRLTSIIAAGTLFRIEAQTFQTTLPHRRKLLSSGLRKFS